MLYQLSYSCTFVDEIGHMSWKTRVVWLKLPFDAITFFKEFLQVCRGVWFEGGAALVGASFGGLAGLLLEVLLYPIAFLAFFTFNTL